MSGYDAPQFSWTCEYGLRFFPFSAVKDEILVLVLYNYRENLNCVHEMWYREPQGNKTQL